MQSTRYLCAALLSLSTAAVASAAVAPYATDAATLALYHFDESAGTIVNHAGNTALDMTNTGGPTGRAGGGGGYNASAYTGFGSAFNVLNSGDGTYYSSGSSNSSKGGLLTASAVTQSSLQGANGAFTYEALVQVNGTSDEQTILAHDGGNGSRGFLFRVTSGTLSLYTGSTSITAAIPTTGPNAYAADTWFHAAITYTGLEGQAGNVTFYWTRVDTSAAAANAIGSATLSADMTLGDANLLGIGTTTRAPFRFQPTFIDEVRISNIARAPDDFVFVPEPASLALLACGGLMLVRRR